MQEQKFCWLLLNYYCKKLLSRVYIYYEQRKKSQQSKSKSNQKESETKHRYTSSDEFFFQSQSILGNCVQPLCEQIVFVKHTIMTTEIVIHFEMGKYSSH